MSGSKKHHPISGNWSLSVASSGFIFSHATLTDSSPGSQIFAATERNAKAKSIALTGEAPPGAMRYFTV